MDIYAKTQSISPLRRTVSWLLLLPGMVYMASAVAHHAFSAEFDADAPVHVAGRITRLEWINPHAWLHVVETRADGTNVHWMFEGGTPNTLVRNGLNKNTLAIGTEVVIRGYQSKGRSCTPICKANGRDVAFADGRKVFMGSSGTGAPNDGSDPS